MHLFLAISLCACMVFSVPVLASNKHIFLNSSVLYNFVVFVFFSYICLDSGNWDCTTLRPFCTLMMKGGTILMATGRHVDNEFIPGLNKKPETDF